MFNVSSIDHHARPRSTVKLTGTASKTTVSLDDRSAFAIDHAQAFHLAASRLSVPASGVIRRALEVYSHHLATVTDPLDEFKALRRSCSTHRMVPQDRHEAGYRFKQSAEQAKEGQRPASFSVLYHGPNVLDMEAITAQAEERVRQNYRVRFTGKPKESTT